MYHFVIAKTVVHAGANTPCCVEYLHIRDGEKIHWLTVLDGACVFQSLSEAKTYLEKHFPFDDSRDWTPLIIRRTDGGWEWTDEKLTEEYPRVMSFAI